MWHLIVGPNKKDVHDLKQVYSAHLLEVSQGEEMMLQSQVMVDACVSRMCSIRDDLLSQFKLDGTTDARKHIQESAEQFDLTISHIDPLRSTITRSDSKVSEDEIRLETKGFRVECVGPYNGLVQYIEDLSSTSHVAKVNSFRIIPVSRDTARMTLQVSVYHFEHVPETLTKFFEHSSIGSDGEKLHGAI